MEAGSSAAIDAGLYQEQQAAGTAPYPAFAPVQATYYIPRDEPASGSQWFVVQVANAFRSSPATVTSDEYLQTITPPAGGVLHLTVPGFYSPAQALSQARVSDLEQFAAYDPPAGGGAPRIVADYSGITGTS